MIDLATIDQARERADRIRTHAIAVADWLADIRGAYAARDWEALGYQTWQEYLEGEFGDHRISLPREERREVVAVMSRAGMSVRAIAPALGVSRETVRRDQGEPTDTNVSVDEPARVQSLDGRSRPATQPRRAAPATPEPPVTPWRDHAPALVEQIDQLTTEPVADPAPRPIPTEDQIIDALDRRKPGVRAEIEQKRYRARWSAAIAGASDITLLDPEHVAAALEPNVLGLGVSTLRRALRIAEDAEQRMQPGLRIVGGAQ